MHWTSDKIEGELDKLQAFGINRHTVTPLLYRIRDDYELHIADTPHVEAVKIRTLEERIARLQQYIDDLEIALYGSTAKAYRGEENVAN